MSATITSLAAGRHEAVARTASSERWSARRTVAFVILVCGVFWLAVAAFISLALRAF